jgi:prepilin-type N-terminal cleavage/methylation domain-containing protein
MNTRRGFTLIEVTIAIVVLMFITGAAVQFLRRQTNLVTRETTRMDALQNAQFAASQLERELRQAGAGVVDRQPMMVQIDSEAVTFNANMVSIDSGDVRAVYQMADANPNAVRVMTLTEALPLPNVAPPGRMYPDTTYMAATGVAGDAETISYWLRPDSASKLPKRYVLFRRVNAQAPTLVARGLVKDARDTIPIITYYTADTLSRLVPVPRTLLPIIHGKVHGAASDTGRGAITDSVRAVRVHFLAAARDPRTGKDGLRTVEVLVRLMNAGLLQRTSCGQPPYGVSAVVATSSVANAPVKTVTITWSKSTDDGAGEKDVERYALYRRLSTDLVFGDPISSIPASVKASYSYVDTQVVPNQTYVYGVSAQDCTPLLSPMSIAPLAVTVNP